MKKIHYLKFSACLLCAYALSACSLEPLDDDMQKELFTRNFIKDFGLIDPNQDWNMAQSAVVTVNVGATPSRVKIYADYGDKYYLVADLDDASGVLKVPVDVPKSSRNVLVKVNGLKFYSQLGKTVDCTNMSRGVPDPNASYAIDSNGNPTYTNDNAPTYEETKNGYTIKVRHTKSGNNNTEYKLFNTEQMSALVSPTPWHEYWSLNLDGWSGPNSDNEIGLLPESGVYNRTQEQLTSWVDAKIAQNHSMTYDFTIDTGSDGSFTFFPYYYGTNLVHEVGVYLLDSNGNPVIKNGGTYDNTKEALPQFVSFPIFHDRQAGDLQIQPHFDSAIEEICLADDLENGYPKNRYSGSNKLQLYKDDKVNLSDKTYIKRDGAWMTYKSYVTTYGDQYVGRAAYHIWVNENENIVRAECEEQRTTNGVIWNAIGRELGEGKYALVSIVTGIHQDDPGRSHFTGVQDNFNYDVVNKPEPPKASPVKSITLTLPSNMLDSNGSLLLHYASDSDRQTFDITTSMIKCKDGDEVVMSVDDYWNEIDFNGWYDEYFYTTKDDNNHKFTITPKKATPAPASGETYNSVWPRIFADSNINTVGYDDSDAKANFNLVIRDRNSYNDHSASATYTTWPSGVNASDYVKSETSSSASTTTLLSYSDGLDLVSLQAWNVSPGNTVTTSQFTWLTLGSNVKNGDVLRITLNKGACIALAVKNNGSAISAYQSNYIAGTLDFNVTSDYATLINSDGIGISTNESAKLMSIELVDNSSSTLTTTYSWKYDSSKSQAQSALENYYKTVSKTCDGSDCSSTSNGASNLNVTVNITDTNPVDDETLNHNVNWSWSDVTYFLPESQRNAPQRHGVKGKTNSRASGGKPALLEYDGNIGWYDANHIWSRFMPLREEVASYPPNNTVLARSRGYDVTVTVNGQPYVGKLGLYMKVLGEYGEDNGSPKAYVDYGSNSYYVYSQRAYNRDKQGALYPQISAMAVKHPVTKNTYLTFEDMLVDNSSNTNKKGSDRDVNDLIFFVTNYKSIEGDKGTITDEEETDEGFPWIWALEDLGSTDDFDFNDLVVRVSSLTVKNKEVDNTGDEPVTRYTGLYRKVTFTPLAAGGILPVYICFHTDGHDYYLRPGDYNLTGTTLTVENVTFGNLSDLGAPNESAGEVHRWFGNGNYTNASMINTGFGPGGLKGKSCTLYVTCPDIDPSTGAADPTTGFQMNFFSGNNKAIDASTLTSNANYFYALVDGSSQQNALDADKAGDTSDGYVILNTELGAAPQSFVIMGDNWRWPKERSHILKAYSGFKEWVKNKDAGNRWFEAPTNTSELY